MNSVNTVRDTCRKRKRRLCNAAMLLCGFAVAAQGGPPTDPLPAPLFSFAAGSPTVLGGFVDADGILMFGFPHPDIMHLGNIFGMGRLGDDLDAMSVANASFAPTTSFALLFSIDGNSVATAAPDPNLVALGVPYNALDQALRGQAAGDQFMSTTLFLLAGGGRTASRQSSNNVLLRNNFDEGGTDFAAEPPTSANDDAGAQPQDTVDATAATTELSALYFSASAASPSLDFLPGSGSPSGAHVFYFGFSQDPLSLYASFADLGLQQEDDIDALVVFDTDNDRTFNGSDTVLFSLTAGSPSLTTIPSASSTGAAADVFVAAPGQSPALFASAAVLGLGDSQDNIDALEYLACDDVDACAAARGIRGTNPIPTLSMWGITAMVLLLLVAGTIIMSRRRPRGPFAAGM